MKNSFANKEKKILRSGLAKALFLTVICTSAYAGEQDRQRSITNDSHTKLKSVSSAAINTSTIKYEIIGYFPSWTSEKFPATPGNIDAKKLSVINYAFLDICWNGKHGNSASDHQGDTNADIFLETVCKDSEGTPVNLPDGAVTLGNSPLDTKNLADLVALKSINPQLKVLPSIGGWVWSNRFSDMAASAETRANFTKSSIALIRKHQLDGIDLDWEYPTSIGLPCATKMVCQRPDDKPNFIRLAQELRSAFDQAGAADGKHYLITIASGAGADYVNDTDGSNAWIALLAKSLDWINVMTYDYHGPFDQRSGFNAPLFSAPGEPKARSTDASIKLYLAAGVPAKKLTLGVPFYGYGWRGCDAGKTKGMFQPCTGAASAGANGNTFTFAYLVSQGYLKKDASGKYLVGGRGYQRYWNSIAKVPYLYNAAEKTVISYDDEISIHLKNIYIQSRGLRGGMFWELNADSDKILGTVMSNDLAH